MSPGADLIVRANLTREAGYTAAVGMLRRADRPTAIFTSNDLQARILGNAASRSRKPPIDGHPSSR